MIETFGTAALLSGGIVSLTMLGLRGLFGRKDKKFQCPKCGADVDAHAGSCPHCGARFEKGGFECPKCKTQVSYNALECPSCGERFEGAESYACPECGALVKATSKRCPDCGAKFWSPIKPSA